ncbi:hypothetical protein Ocin01_00405 [Orchesella cincta]|uniref:Uncharacterized protein n=1 Tax=Orchesella cincta TaxID=48709 RepID=A0A1D2NLW5_ORCCI|nr:hypothetical protein Ocin01_00405 [Orchesella cincta]
MSLKMFMMKRTTTQVLVVIIGLLLSDIQLAQGLKCYFCNGCKGKGTEIECKPPIDAGCVIHAPGNGVVQRDCSNEAAAGLGGKCDGTDKNCYCTTDLCNGGAGKGGSMVIGNSKRTLQFSAVASVAAYLMGTTQGIYDETDNDTSAGGHHWTAVVGHPSGSRTQVLFLQWLQRKKGTETECKPPNDSTCIIHAGLGIVQRGCANEAAALVPEKCDSTDKTCYCTTDLCTG